MRKIVVPGDVIAETPVRLENTYIEKGRTFADALGLFDSERKQVVSLEGIWMPRIGDIVIGIVTNERNSVYEINLSFFGRAILIGDRMDRNKFKVGDVVEAEVKDVENRKTVILWRPRSLRGGNVLEVKPAKIPRLIGKNNTMIEQIKNYTGCLLVVGMNGIVWMRGGDISLATTAIRQVEGEAHISGLTERIKSMLEKGKSDLDGK